MYSTFLRLILGAFLVFALAFPALAFAEVEAEAPVAVSQTSSDAPLHFSPDKNIGEGEAFLLGPRSTAGVITSYALSGAALGALVGLGGYIISGFDWSPWNIAYFGAGGLVVGGIVGSVVALTAAADRPVANSVEWMERDMPKTVQFRILNLGF